MAERTEVVLIPPVRRDESTADTAGAGYLTEQQIDAVRMRAALLECSRRARAEAVALAETARIRRVLGLDADK